MPTNTRNEQSRAVRDLGEVDWYRLPSWYDMLHAAGTADEVRGLERIEQRFVRTKRGARRWFEPACGTGRYLLAAARRGVAVEGIDLEPAMIEYARARFDRTGLTGSLRVGDMTKNVAKRPAALAFCLLNTLRHLPTDRAMLDHFACVRRSIRKGGVYVVGLGTTEYGGEMPSEDVWSARRGRIEVIQIANYLPPEGSTGRARFETVINALSRRTPRSIEHASNTYRLRAYSRDQWRALLRRAGWRVEGLLDEHGDEVAPADDAFDHRGYGLWVLSPESRG